MRADQDAGDRYVFLDYLRAIAAWLVVWDHMVADMLGASTKVFPPAQWVRTNIAGPLGIIQDFGWLGVALFFLISGFIISDRARVESLRAFIIRRVLRIYPMLFVAVLICAALEAMKSGVKLSDVALNLTLANYLVVPQVTLLGVAWTLVIEVIFYILTAATQFARASPHRIAINLALVALVLWKRNAFGLSFSLFSVAASYLPILFMGQTLYWWLSRRRLPAAMAMAYLAACYGLFLWGLRAIQPGFLAPGNSYLISLAYALLIFICAMHLRPQANRFIRYLSDTSYGMYLLHGLAGVLVFGALLPKTPLWLAIAAAILAAQAAAAVGRQLVEIPAQRLARRLTRSAANPVNPLSTDGKGKLGHDEP